MKASGETTKESVYWPEIPADIIADARALRQLQDDPLARSSYLAKVEASIPGAGSAPGSVAIHHSGPNAEAFVVFASYDVIVGRTPFHFDLNGDRVFDPPY